MRITLNVTASGFKPFPIPVKYQSEDNSAKVECSKSAKHPVARNQKFCPECGSPVKEIKSESAVDISKLPKTVTVKDADEFLDFVYYDADFLEDYETNGQYYVYVDRDSFSKKMKADVKTLYSIASCAEVNKKGVLIANGIDGEDLGSYFKKNDYDVDTFLAEMPVAVEKAKKYMLKQYKKDIDALGEYFEDVKFEFIVDIW